MILLQKFFQDGKYVIEFFIYIRRNKFLTLDGNV